MLSLAWNYADDSMHSILEISGLKCKVKAETKKALQVHMKGTHAKTRAKIVTELVYNGVLFDGAGQPIIKDMYAGTLDEMSPMHGKYRSQLICLQLVESTTMQLIHFTNLRSWSMGNRALFQVHQQCRDRQSFLKILHNNMLYRKQAW